MLERVISFTVFGLFIFTPSLHSWWHLPVLEWYQPYWIWLALIGLCWWASRSDRDQGPRA